MQRSAKLGNSRLLFRKQGLEDVDLNAAAAAVDQFVESSRQVELMHEKIFVYPKDGVLWVGREIAGYPTELPEGVFMQDFGAVKVRETSLGPAATFEDAFNEGQKLAQKLGEKPHRFVFGPQSFSTPLFQFGASSIFENV